MRLALLTLAGLFTGLLLSAGLVLAQGTVKIGVIYPLSGNAAGAGKAAKAGVELMTEIVNNAHPELAPLPLAAGAGLPNLKGAKVEPIFSDHQGNPSVGASETVRLITQEKVVAMMGVYHSSVAMSATAEAERNGVPFVIGDSVAMGITSRGFKNTFRVTPHAQDLARMYAAFLNDMKAMRPVKTVALVNENTDYGTSVAKFVGDAIKEAGYSVVASIAYSANTTDVSAQVLQLKSLNPDVVIFITYTNDAILYMKTLRNLDYRPGFVIGDDAGFSDPSFATSVGNLAQGVFNRSAFTPGKPGSLTFKINQMFRAKTGNDIDDATGRSMQGFLVLCDAINRAGSTDPEAIKKALRETNMGPSQVMLGYRGVKFDQTGQNVEAYSYVTQLVGDRYLAVWPQNMAEAKITNFFKGW
jgi:branched-chain amino acid transport system substrate-binding protein